jgi:hypothetical protein
MQKGTYIFLLTHAFQTLLHTLKIMRRALVQKSVSCRLIHSTGHKSTYGKTVQVIHALAVTIALAFVAPIERESSARQWCMAFGTTVARCEALYDVRIPFT